MPDKKIEILMELKSIGNISTGSSKGSFAADVTKQRKKTIFEKQLEMDKLSDIGIPNILMKTLMAVPRIMWQLSKVLIWVIPGILLALLGISSFDSIKSLFTGGQSNSGGSAPSNISDQTVSTMTPETDNTSIFDSMFGDMFKSDEGESDISAPADTGITSPLQGITADQNNSINPNTPSTTESPKEQTGKIKMEVEYDDSKFAEGVENTKKTGEGLLVPLTKFSEGISTLANAEGTFVGNLISGPYTSLSGVLTKIIGQIEWISNPTDKYNAPSVDLSSFSTSNMYAPKSTPGGQVTDPNSATFSTPVVNNVPNPPNTSSNASPQNYAKGSAIHMR